MVESVHFIKIAIAAATATATFATFATHRMIGDVLFLNVAFVAFVAVAGGM